MNSFIAVFKRELKGYFITPVAYVFLVIFLFFAASLQLLEQNKSMFAKKSFEILKKMV